MISVSGKKWIERKVNKNLVEKIKQDFNFNEILSRLIISRNFDLDEINNINDDLKTYNDFINNNDFNKATDLLIDTIKNKENICILGDYDVDGSTSTEKRYSGCAQAQSFNNTSLLVSGFSPRIICKGM